MLSVSTDGTPIPGQYIYPRMEVTRARQGRAGSPGGELLTELDYTGRTVRTREQGLEQTTIWSERAYDSKGRLTGSTLPHVRTSQVPTTLYTYDGLDRLTRMQRSDGSIVQHEYADAVTPAETNRRWLSGLPTARFDEGRFAVQDALGESRWTYDEGPNALGRLSGTTSPATAENPLGQRQRYFYEPPPANRLLIRGALQRIDHIIDGVTYSMRFEYDDLVRPNKVRYPALSGFARPPIVTEYSYDASGSVKQVNEVGSGVSKLLWKLTHAFEGQVVKNETFGNGAATTYGYDAQRYFLNNITTTLGTVSGSTTPLAVQSLGYGHYPDGRVSLRTDATTPGSTRTLDYTYDLLNRLDTITEKVNGATTLTTHHAYDPLGNITQRGAVTTTYDPARPHFIQTVDANTYGYDDNGNVSSRSGPDIPGGAQTFDYMSASSEKRGNLSSPG